MSVIGALELVPQLFSYNKDRVWIIWSFDLQLGTLVPASAMEAHLIQEIESGATVFNANNSGALIPGALAAGRWSDVLGGSISHRAPGFKAGL
ncbi:hypothetical protein N7468_007147 [Penicillium chermesinum]|uniref:Uncharacterized protein n=1 Tax=Penicillium chermesinum TaxID=63820 RepID=A0A9W9NTM5_9EURO|nr:uncharacterized protein N7468_007147 [Penicillium chermesinum]KAJ5225922.1 hypothetical protein N7468_007147 [Penicillium chermesinum]